MRAVRAWWKPGAAAAVILAVAGAFLAWGPVGLGSGPLWAGVADGGQDMSVAPHQTWGLFIMLDPRRAAVVVDHLTIRGGDGYPGPRVLSLWADRDEQCAGTFPWRGQQGVLRSCAPGGLTRLGSRPFLPGASLMAGIGTVRYRGEAIVAEVAPPARDCWVVTSVVIHYHVGIRHYAVTRPVSFAACLTGHEADTASTALDRS